VEFLTVLGNLTAEVLTPALHADLSRLTPEESDSGDQESHLEPQDPKSSGEGSEP